MRSKNRLWSSKKEKEDMKKSKIESHNGIKILLNSNTYLSSWLGIKLNDTYKNLQFDFKKNNPIVNRIGMGLTCLTRFSPLFVCTSLEGCHQNLQMTGTRLLFLLSLPKCCFYIPRAYNSCMNHSFWYKANFFKIQI